MITSAHEPFSTLRLLSVPAGSDPSGEPLLSNAGLLIEVGSARTAWDGLPEAPAGPVRFLTVTTNDLTGPELSSLANRLNDRPPPLGLSEASAARVAHLHAEATRLLGRAPGLGPEGPGGLG
jgi:hypothetical protein